MVMDPNKMASFLCDANQWYYYFTFPPSFNVSKLVEAVCNVDGEELQKEIMDSLKLENVLMVVSIMMEILIFNSLKFRSLIHLW